MEGEIDFDKVLVLMGCPLKARQPLRLSYSVMIHGGHNILG